MAINEIISNEMTWYLMRILMFYVTPSVSGLGVVGNILSITVLTRHGLQKCSNILLVSLAFSDMMYLISFNSVPKILYEAVWNHEYRGFSQHDTHVLFVFFSIFTLFDYACGLSALTLPMLITFERLVVIFFPLNFQRFITPRRTWAAVVGVTIYWFSIFIYASFWSEVQYGLDPVRNVSVGLIKNSAFYYDHLSSVALIQDLLIFSSMIVPPLLTVAGCVVISIQIRITSARRSKLTSKTVSTSRTTRMLLAVCLVYTFNTAFLSLPLYIPQYASYSLTDDNPPNIVKIFYQAVNTMGCINSSSNFLVYFLLNKNFRTSLLHLCSPCNCTKV
ncbi:neuropeptide Y receptor type 1-like [Physella acuta]|uniref:neuropeptide Y receptor type 1-like n=1 Tax=Physella acuta TaxID=109671 RepID=UPI0027DE7B84|nr:neuropeptide Y receptor type 1-like [Physella acuta]